MAIFAGNVQEWFSLFFLLYRCVLGFAVLNVVNAVFVPLACKGSTSHFHGIKTHVTRFWNFLFSSNGKNHTHQNCVTETIRLVLFGFMDPITVSQSWKLKPLKTGLVMFQIYQWIVRAKSSHGVKHDLIDAVHRFHVPSEVQQTMKTASSDEELAFKQKERDVAMYTRKAATDLPVTLSSYNLTFKTCSNCAWEMLCIAQYRGLCITLLGKQTWILKSPFWTSGKTSISISPFSKSYIHA